MQCCADRGCSAFFNEKLARRDARRYRKKGLRGPASRIVDFLRRRGIEGRSVLEVGGGVGAVDIELLKAGAAHATLVELSPAYEPFAREIAREAGVDARLERRLLDFAAQPEEIEPADVVVMNKVVCCYPDYDALVGAAAERTTGTLVMTFPRDAWWTRAGFGACNLVLRLRKSSFRAFVHPPASIVAAATSRGLRPVEEHVGAVWRFAALERA